jgi:hypothetical protein
MAMVMVMASGCLAEGERVDGKLDDNAAFHVEAAPGPSDSTYDVCALAAELPASNVCSLICDVDAMKAALRAEGDPAGRCYDWECRLPDASVVFVGVCLEPDDPRASARSTRANAQQSSEP